MKLIKKVEEWLYYAVQDKIFFLCLIFNFTGLFLLVSKKVGLLPDFPIQVIDALFWMPIVFLVACILLSFLIVGVTTFINKKK